MDLVARLRAEARETNERRLLVLAGSPDATRRRAADALDSAGTDLDRTTLLGQVDFLECERLAPRAARTLLGATRDAIVVDCHDECRPNALGIATGAVDGGGLLVLLTPPLSAWPDRRDDFDESLAVPPFERGQVIGYSRRRFAWTLRQHRGVAIVEVGPGGPDSDTVVDDGLVHPAPRRQPRPPDPPEDAAFPAAAYEAALTADQADAVATLEALAEPGTAVVVEADRGRGKSSAAGLAAASLALEGRDVLVTAPDYRNAAAVFERAETLLVDLGDLAGRDRDDHP